MIVGGVLAGQSLIKQADTRALISQIERYQTAMRTFQARYGYLPGDIPPLPAAQFGFMARAGTEGRGDGNGLVEGWTYVGGCTDYTCGYVQGGETAFFWEDLSAAHMMDGSFNTATDAQMSGNVTLTSSPSIYNWIPQAKLGSGNFVFVTEFFTAQGGVSSTPIDYFTVAGVTLLNAGYYTANPAMTVAQAFRIDKKIDDGLPETGHVEARYTPAGMTTNATPPSPTSCYDNGSNGSIPMTYSIAYNNGAGMNCGLSFQFQ